MTKHASQMDWSAQGGGGPELHQSFLVPAMLEPFAPLLVDAAGVRAGSRVLDVACGTGVISREAARRAGPDGRVLGIDLGEPMLEMARAQPAQPGAAPIEYRQGVAEELPAADESFDVVTCHQGLQFFPDRPEAVAQMRHVLAPGGRVAIATWAEVERQPHFAALCDVVGHHLGEEVGEMMRSPFALHDPAELEALLDEAGFHDVRVQYTTLPVVYASHAEFAPRYIGASPVADIFAGARPAQRDAVTTEVAEALRDHATPDGRLASSMTALFATASTART
jgi:ubiquinone/menaquinone biosynthesis C-methylase UbiE